MINKQKDLEEEECEEEKNSYESEDDTMDVAQDYYEWVMIPNCNPDDRKTGVTFKGDTEEYIAAKEKIFKLLVDIGHKWKKAANFGQYKNRTNKS